MGTLVFPSPPPSTPSLWLPPPSPLSRPPRLPRPPPPTLPLLPPPLPPLLRRGRSVRPTLLSSQWLLPLATTDSDTDSDTTDSDTPDTPATSDTDSTRWRSCFYLNLDCYV